MLNILFRTPFERAFGTYPLKGIDVIAAVEHAINVGYRCFDTAQLYENEAEVGEAIFRSGIPRSNFCINTKVHPDNYTECKFIPSVESSVSKLKTDYVDILFLHFPPKEDDFALVISLLNETLDKGLASNIGISNFTTNMMHNAAKLSKARFASNQVEFHPLLDQRKLISAAFETGIPLSSYCSLARGEIFKHPEFAEIAKGYDRTAAQITLRWILQKGVPINTKSSRLHNLKTNFDVMDFTLSGTDMAKIDAKTNTNFRVVTAERAPWVPVWD